VTFAAQELEQYFFLLPLVSKIVLHSSRRQVLTGIKSPSKIVNVSRTTSIPQLAPVAQRIRAGPFYGHGREFKSLQGHVRQLKETKMDNLYEVELEWCDEDYLWSYLCISVLASGEFEAAFKAGQLVHETDGIRAVAVKLKQDNSFGQALARSFGE
jgi:hypothetical protein